MTTPPTDPASRPSSTASRLTATLVLGAFGVLVAACASGEPGAARTGGVAPAPPSGDARAALQALIGDAACQSDTQCRTVAVGWKSCGGPDAYVAWSVARSDASAIAAAGARSTEAARRDAQQRGLLSNCAMVLDPGAACVPVDVATPGAGTPTGARTCRLRAGRGAGGAGIY